MEQRIRVVAAARSASRRAEAAELLRGIAEVELIGGFATGSVTSDLSYDVVLYVLEDGEPPETIAAASHMPVLFLYSGGPESLRRSASDAWLPEELSFLPARCSPRELAAAVAAVAAGLTVRHPSVVGDGSTGVLPGHGRRGDGASRGDLGSPTGDVLTRREREVLTMIADGLPNKAIAVELGITSHTVKFHIASIMQKLRAASRTEAVTVGLRRGIILL